ncbi:MAG TPA: HAD-IB family phosphatase [Xanthobacteraceae bacterium]|nr:HAD-IB family phosphatase [Xanthobacteraceae bacterium]
MNLDISIDFDGTVTLADTTDFMLERFADPKWHEVEAEWVEGRIGSRECLARQAALLRATSEEFDAALDTVETDPGFVRFLREAHALGATTKIVSDGFDRFIEPVLARLGVEIPLLSNRLLPAGPQSWRAEFPHLDADCRSESGVCKCAALAPGKFRLLIGDGRSDFCVAEEADFVFAKDALVEFCREQNIPYRPIASFRDASVHMAELCKLIARGAHTDGAAEQVQRA